MDISSAYHITEFISGQMQKTGDDTYVTTCGEDLSTRPPTHTKLSIPIKFVEYIFGDMHVYFACEIKNPKQLVIECMGTVSDSLTGELLNELDLRSKLY